MSLQDKLTQIKNRADAATEGPWGNIDFFSNQEVEGHLAIHLGEHAVGSLDGILHSAKLSETDQAFISHARTDIPKLLRVIERLIKLRDEMATAIANETGNAYNPEPWNAELEKILEESGE